MSGEGAWSVEADVEDDIDDTDAVRERGGGGSGDWVVEDAVSVGLEGEGLINNRCALAL